MTIKKELELIRKENGGILKPNDVVTFAEDPKTALHKRFEWDDNKAAHEYRLEQARYIIRVAVIVNPSTGENIRTYVSLRNDRDNGDSYRTMVDVLNDKKLFNMMLEDALTDLHTFENKYDSLKEAGKLKKVFAAIETLPKTVKNKSRKKSA